jgi:hypothetical protein
VQVEAVTKQWDHHFDALLEFIMRPVRNDDTSNPSEWCLMEWMSRGGHRERRLAAWVAEQRHLAACNRLSSAARGRLEVLFCWLACDELEWLSS